MRRGTLVFATILLAVALYIANASAWMNTYVLDSDQFVSTAVEAMDDKATRDASAEIIVDKLVEEFPLLTLLDAALASLFSDLLARDTIEDLLVASATNVHRRMIEGDQSAFIINLEPYRGMLLAPLESLSPELAALVPADWFESVEVIEAGVLPDLSTYNNRASTVSIVAAIASVGLTVLVFIAARRWNYALIAVGVALFVAGGISLLLLPGARSTADFLIEDEPSSVLVTNVFNAFTSTLTTRSIAMLGLGVLLLIIGGFATFTRSQRPASMNLGTTP